MITRDLEQGHLDSNRTYLDSAWTPEIAIDEMCLDFAGSLQGDPCYEQKPVLLTRLRLRNLFKLFK